VIIDAHAHVWRRWPYDPVPDEVGRGSFNELVSYLDANHVDKAVLVSANIEGNHDNNHYGAEAVARHPDRFIQIADIDSRWSAEYHIRGASDRLHRLVDAFNPIGVSHYLAPDNDGWLTSEEGLAFFKSVSAHRLLVGLAAPPPWFADVRALARTFPETTFLVNHLGLVTLYSGGEKAALSMVIDHEDLPNLLVKVSGYYYAHRSPRGGYPFTDRMDIVRAFYESWGPRRMIWASDFPSLLEYMSYGESLDVLREHAPFIGPKDLVGILGGTLEDVLARRM
jgi:predicted TIM-barrel fold metal-dependent hydrolase